MRKIFIDIGGWTGVSAEFFLKNHPKANEFDIFTFECDKKNIEIIQKKNLPITLIKKAVWSRNGKIKFYFSNGGTKAGGTIYSSKKTGHIDDSNYYEVECIDIAEFIRFFNEDDYIIMKLNCEGAEYEIIPRLKDEGLLHWINKWYVQWHWDKIGISKEKHDQVARMIKSYNWECQFNASRFKNYFFQTL
jgi:FkbM family methyltransferase